MTTPPLHHQNIKAIRPDVRVNIQPLEDGTTINRMLVKGDVDGIDELLHGYSRPSIKPQIPQRPTPIIIPEAEVEEEPEDNGLRIVSDQHIRYHGSEVVYHAKGRLSFDQTSLKVLLIIEDKHNGRKYRFRVDMYDGDHIKKTCCELSDAEEYDVRDMQKELATFTDLLEAHRDKLMTPTAQKQEARRGTSTALVQQAHAILQQENLLDQLDQLIEQAGVVGEEKTRLPMLVMASTYKMDHPLHMLIQGGTGTGKSHLLNTIAECFPPEDVLSMTRVTSRSFYHYGEGELVNKLVLIQDFDGLDDEAQFAFREMQSSGQLSCSITRKDRFGNLKAEIKHVEAHFASMVATTKAEVYPDNMNRSVIIGIDESEDQTRRILQHQSRITAGLVNQDGPEQAKELLRCILRQLKHKKVVNHYADQVMLPLHSRAIRRLNNQFQSLVSQVTMLHQFQRETDQQGRLVATKDDLLKAVELFIEAIYLKTDELDPSTRQFFELLKDYLKTQTKGSTHRFTAREVRQALHMSKAQTFRQLDTLKSLEYVAIMEGSANRGFKYEVTYWDDAEKIRNAVKTHLNSQIGSLQASDSKAYSAGVPTNEEST